MDEDALVPARVATWRRFGALVPREIPGQRSLPSESRLLPSGWHWWGLYAAELDPEYLRESLEEAATTYEREYSKRMGRAVVPFAEWKRTHANVSQPPPSSTGATSHAAEIGPRHPHTFAPGQAGGQRHPRRNQMRKRKQFRGGRGMGQANGARTAGGTGAQGRPPGYSPPGPPRPTAH